MNIPQGYKQTELGIIPEDWAVRQLGDCVNVYDGTHQTPNYVPVGIPFYSVENVTVNNFSHTKHISPNEHKILTSRYKIQKGDILMTRIGSIGVCKYVDWDVDASFYVSLALLKPYNIDALYLLMASNATYFKDSILLNSLQFAIPQKINLGNISNVKILVPPIAEQRAIAEALSDVDGLIAALDKKIAKKRLLKQGAMCKLLSLSGRGKKWFNTRLGNVVSIRKGSMLTSDRFVAGNIPVIAGGKIPAGYHNVANRPANTITISASGASAGYVALYNKPIFATDCSTIEPCSTYDIHYIYHLLKYYQSEIFAMQTGGAQPHVHPSDLNELQILYAKDIKEQQAIATILSDMDKEIADLEAQHDKYRLLKSGMMQKLLTGQIRLVKQQAKIIPLGVEVPAVREIPIDAHIIAGHIVNRSYQSRGWGRTKLQKSLHLIGYCTQLNLGNEYIRNTAGPDDQQLMNYIDQKFKQYRHVKRVCEKLPDGKTHYSYTPTSMIQEVEIAYEQYPKELRDKIDALIDKLKTMNLPCAEMISTLYAVWNNRIIKEELINDDLLISDFYAWSTHKADFEETRVRKALNYMRKENIIPVGWGKYIDKR